MQSQSASQLDETLPCMFCGNPKNEHYGKPGKIQPGDRLKILGSWATVILLDVDVVTFKLDGNPNYRSMLVNDITDTGPAFRCKPDFASSTYMASTHQKCGRCERHVPRTVPLGQYWLCPECAASEKSIAERVNATEDRKPLPLCKRCNASPAVTHFKALRVCRGCLVYLETLRTAKNFADTTTVANDPVNPSHYTFGKIEVADALEDWQLNLWRGTVVKYVVRAGRKRKETEVEDLKKAAWYLAREIARMEK